jgi:sphinganine C4-monooxygenase
VPYAYGALYNHPLEGFFLDTLGGGIAYLLTGQTTRQSMFFFTFSTIKTVDDHCGYALPWDPLQHVTGNNAAYHDIHHQSWGIKTNFSQPFFTFWDAILGTMWRGGDVRLRYEKARRAADVWWEEQRRLAATSTSDKKEWKNAKPTSSSTDDEKMGGIVDVKSTPALPPAQPVVDSASTPRARRSPRKANNSAQLKGLKERMVNSGSLPNGVPRVESNR